MKRFTKRLPKILVIALAAIAAIVLAGLAKGTNMYGWIIAYWAVLTAKNVADWVNNR